MTTIASDHRRRALVRAAFDLVAEHGLEGLRTRDVAARAGVNVATLHYYFATKDALVTGIVDLLAEEYGVARGVPYGMPNAMPNETPNASPRAAGDMRARLRAEFADARHDRFERPALQRVSLELRLRADRDAALRGALEPLAAAWRHRLEAILGDGVFDGVFRRDLDVPATATVILAMLWGATGLIGVNAEAFDAACDAIEKLVLR